MPPLKTSRLLSILERLQDDRLTLRLAHMVRRHARPGERRPVIFFNASTRLRGHSLNAGYALLAAWALRLAGVPVAHFVCQAGMTRCILGTDQHDFSKEPPCTRCIRQSRVDYAGTRPHFFSFQREETLARALADLSVAQLARYEHPWQEERVPLGALVLPSVRWRLRLHNLADDEPTRFLFREYLLSVWNVFVEFAALLERLDPQVVVLFNGQFFPEAAARWLAIQRSIRVVTHEVGMQPMTGFFTAGEATAYPVDIPPDFALSPARDARLEAYLEKRFQGKFSMAGIQFWPEMKGLDETFLQKAAGFRQIVPIFTNVIFDTSQPHSNVVFPDMFTWLEGVLEVIQGHPETLFVLRAHPDEARPGKASRESVSGWVETSGAAALPNVVFIPPDRYLSSYELIQRSKFVMIYNSTIGLEAAILGAAVLCAGKARFTQYPTVFFPASQAEYRRTLEDFLDAGEVKARPEHPLQARRFLYYQLFRTSLPFETYLEPLSRSRGYVRFKPFDWQALLPAASPTIQTLLEGILENGDFLLPEGTNP